MANYETITLEKGMYNINGKSLTNVLEELDPSENYESTPLGGLDAYERQLKRFNIKVNGIGSDTVEKFFQNTSSSALFPEYVRRAVYQGMTNADMLPQIVATVTNINGMDYRSITTVASQSEKSLKPVKESAAIPQIMIKMQDNLVNLQKHGRMLVSSYEALRFQRLDLFTVTLRQIGAQMARTQLGDAVNVLLNGDGNGNPCAAITTATPGTVTYNDLLKLWGSLAPYELNTLLAPTSVVQTLLSMPEMKDSLAGLNFQGTGKMITPMGASLLHVPSIPGNTIIGLDSSCALEMVQAGDILLDSDKLIDRQLERATISVISGFGKIFNDASLKLTF
ncbi:MAG: phage major capsid protein [Bacillota bacterium]|nr:phage major capsid protein [Bacillota bacterium]